MINHCCMGTDNKVHVWELSAEVGRLRALVREISDRLREHIDLEALIFYGTGNIELNRPYYMNLSSKSLRFINSMEYTKIMEDE